MNETFTDGFFYHPDDTMAKRIVAGNVNPRLDDIFILAIKEAKVDHDAKLKRLERLEDRKANIDAEIAHATEEVNEAARRSQHQHDAIAKYQRGDELDDDEREILTPECRHLVGDQRQVDVENQFKKHAKAIKKLEADNWKVEDKHIKDGCLYVTIKQELVKHIPTEIKVAKKIAKAMAKFFAPDFERQERVQFWNRLGSLNPINPGAG